MAYDFDKADTLIYSDDPEALKSVMDSENSAIHTTTPTSAILYEAEVGAGTKRVFYYHQNFDSFNRVFGIRLVNLGSTSASLKVLPYVQTPDGDVLAVGHHSVVGFLHALIGAAWRPITLQPLGQDGEDTVLATSNAGPGQLASTFLELLVPDAARLKIQVITGGSLGALAQVGRNGPFAGHDGIGRSGIFDLTRGGTTLGDYAAVTWSPTSGPLNIDVPSATPFPNSKIPPVVHGRNPTQAVYGVFTRRAVTLSNPTANPVNVSVYVQACGGDSPGTCMVDQEIIELGAMTSGEQVTRPGYQIGTFTIGPNDAGTKIVDLLGTVDPSGSGPLKIVVATPGSLPLPTSGKQVVFAPGGAPWRA